MKKWTTKERYANYDTYSDAELVRLQTLQKQSQWHLGYHLQPKSGLMNDPNGFTYVNGQWRLAYQNFPYGAVHGLKSWQNLVSDDLQHWHDAGPGLQPSAPYSSQGVYSGSGMMIGQRQFLMYTGNVRTPDGGRISTQLGAWVEEDGTLTELTTPLISGQPEGYTAHFRDPQIMAHGGRYYAILGAQRADLRGTILMYSAPQPEGPWTLDGPLDFGVDSLGYMIECPNLAFVDGKVVLICCPQGIAQDICAYDNIFPNMYLIADDIDWANHRLINPGTLQNLDQGFDCYAAQVVNRPDGDAHLISWLGLPDTTYVSDEEEWQGCFSLVRELHVQNGTLQQKPVVTQLLGAPISDIHDKIDLISVLHFTWDDTTQETFSLGNDKEQLLVQISGNTVTIDRTHVASSSATDYGQTRHITLPGTQHAADLYLDASCFELYADEGQQVLSGRFFPQDPTSWTVNQPANATIAITGRLIQSIY